MQDTAGYIFVHSFYRDTTGTPSGDHWARQRSPLIKSAPDRCLYYRHAAIHPPPNPPPPLRPLPPPVIDVVRPFLYFECVERQGRGPPGLWGDSCAIYFSVSLSPRAQERSSAHTPGCVPRADRRRQGKRTQSKDLSWKILLNNNNKKELQSLCERKLSAVNPFPLPPPPPDSLLWNKRVPRE